MVIMIDHLFQLSQSAVAVYGPLIVLALVVVLAIGLIWIDRR